MEDFVHTNPKGSRGTHSYRLADVGLDGGELRERFRFYQERFGVPDDAPGTV